MQGWGWSGTRGLREKLEAPGSSLPLFLRQDLTLRLLGSVGASPPFRDEPQRVGRGPGDH